MKTSVLFGLLAAIPAFVNADVPLYGQCGGLNYSGETTCASGSFCQYWNDFYWQCIAGTASTTQVPVTSQVTTSATKTTTTTSATSTTKATSTSTSKATTSTTTTKTSSTSSPAATGTVNEKASIGYATLGGGTSGGSGGAVTYVTTLDALTTAVTGSTAAIVIVQGTITGNVVVKVGSNKTLLGAKGATLSGVGLRVLNEKNVIIRNLIIKKVLAEAGDAIGIQASNNIWVDHVDLSSDRDHDKDYYDGLLDITHGCQYVTVSWSVLQHHWKASLVGHSDSNGAEDAVISVTYHHNYWNDLNSRMPSFRFGTGHIFNNYYLNSNDGINSRDGAQLLVENNVFSGVSDDIYSTDAGYVVARGNDLGTGTNTALTGTLTSVPYSYTLTATSSVVSTVLAGAGAILSFP